MATCNRHRSSPNANLSCAAECPPAQLHSPAWPDDLGRSPQVENGARHFQSQPGAPLGQGWGAGHLPGYATHVNTISRAAKYMSTGGYIGIGIGGVSSLLAIQEVCVGDSGSCPRCQGSCRVPRFLKSIPGAARVWSCLSIQKNVKLRC